LKGKKENSKGEKETWGAGREIFMVYIDAKYIFDLLQSYLVVGLTLWSIELDWTKLGEYIFAPPTLLVRPLIY
jgi:hypothetical protein